MLLTSKSYRNRPTSSNSDLFSLRGHKLPGYNIDPNITAEYEGYQGLGASPVMLIGPQQSPAQLSGLNNRLAVEAKVWLLEGRASFCGSPWTPTECPLQGSILGDYQDNLRRLQDPRSSFRPPPTVRTAW